MITLDTLNAINADLDAERVADAKRNRNPTRNRRKKTLQLNGTKLKEQKQNESHSGIDKPAHKIDPENTEHMALHKQMIVFYGLFGKLFGTKVRYDWMYWMYWVTSVFVSFCAFSCIYTVCYRYLDGDYMRMLQPFAITGILVSCLLKWHGFLKHFQKKFSLIFFARKLCLESVTGNRADTINQGLRKTGTVLKAYIAGVAVLLCFFVAVPVKYFFVDKMWIPLLPIEIVFVDQSTLAGFLGATFIDSILGLFACGATIMYGSGFLICICNYSFLVDLIQLDLTDLDEMWNGSSTTSVAFRHAHLHNICKKLQDMSSYLKVVKGIYETKFFLYFLAVYLSQAICLYEITENNWIPGYTVALMLFTEMLFYCLVGTQISIVDDKLCDMIYATNWHTYDLISQRTMQMLLHNCQQPKIIELGTLGTLNVVSFVTLVRSIYSYYAIMTELL